MTRAHARTPRWVKAGAAAALLALLAWWGATWHDTRTNERRLGAIASQIAGRPVAVRCPGPVGRLIGWDIVEGSVRFGAVAPEGEVLFFGPLPLRTSAFAPRLTLPPRDRGDRGCGLVRALADPVG